MTHTRKFHCGAIIVALLSAVLLVPLQAQERRVLPFRYIYAPADEIAKFADEDLRPMQREEFLELLSLLDQPGPHGVSTGVSIDRAEYRATFDGENLVNGSAAITVVKRGDATTYLPLASFNLAIESPVWGRPSQPAELGSRSDGRRMLKIEASDTLRFEWSLVPSIVSSDEFIFPFRLPDCSINRMELLLPPEYELKCDQGVVSRLDDGTNGRLNRWQVEAGGNSEFALRIRSTDAPAPEVFVRQLNTYNVAEQGIELATELRLDCDEAPIAELELNLSPQLKLTRVRQAGKAVPWTVATSVGDEPTSVLLTFDPPLSGLDRTVSLTSFAPLPSTSSLWELPRVQVPVTKWQQESMKLRVSPPLDLRELLLDNARQMRSDTADSDVASTTTISMLQPDAKVTVQVAPSARRLEYSLGTSITAKANEIVADVALGIQSLATEIFELDLEVHQDWTIDAVNWDTADLIHDWQFPGQLNGPSRTLRLNLRNPIATSRDSVIRIRARRRVTTTGRSFTSADLTPIRLPESPASSRFLTVATDDELSARYVDDRRITWLTMDDLDADEALLVTADEQSAIALLRESGRDLRVAFDGSDTERRPFDASIRIDVNLSAESYRERFTISLDRKTPPEPTLRVRLATPHAEAIRWYPASNPQRTLKSSRTEDGPAVLWTIDWPEPDEDNLEIVGEREAIPLEGDMSLPLLRVNGATTQQGVIHLAATADIRLQLKYVDQLTPTPVERDQFLVRSNERRAYRYNPLADIFAGPQPVVAATAVPNTPMLTVREAVLTAYLGQTGVIRCSYDMRIENLGAANLDMNLPSQSDLRYVSIDGMRQPMPSEVEGSYSISLPSSRRFVRVQVHYDESGKPLRFWRSIKLNPPRVPYPVCVERHQIWTPPEYAFHTSRDDQESTLAQCLYRLGGPFLRSRHTQPFEPFSAASWVDLFQVTQPRASLASETLAWLERFGDPNAANWDEVTNQEPVTDSRWIDARRLTDQGIAPGQPIDSPQGSNISTTATQRLRSAGLVLIQMGEAVLLTSSDFVAANRNQLRPTESSVVFEQVIDGDRRQQMPAVGAVLAGNWTAPVSIWTQADAQASPFAAGGWRLQTLDGESGQAAFRVDTFVIAACVAFLLGLSSVWWIRNYSIKAAAAVLVASVVMALALPVPFSWIGMGAFWGGIVGAFLTPAIRVAWAGESTDEPTENPSLITATAILLMTLFTASSFAQEDPSELAPVNDENVFRVYVPSDSQGNAAGDYLLVPTELRRQMFEATAHLRDESSLWLLTSSVYRGSLMRQAGAPQPKLESILAKYDFYVPSAGRFIDFRIPPETMGLLEREARLNGRPLVLTWNDTRTAVRLPIREAGNHELELTLRMPQPMNESLVDIAIPPTPSSTLLLSAPDDLTTFSADGAQGATHRDETTGEIRVELGPTDRLAFRWDSDRVPARSPIEQLSWLQIAPGQVSWQIKLLVDTERWKASTIQVETDRRLRLDRVVSNAPINVEDQDRQGLRTYSYEVPPTANEPLILNMSFVVAGSSGLGNMSLPHLRVLGTERVPHDLAVSFDSQLAGRPKPSDGADRLQISEFASRWEDEVTADFAYRLDEQEPRWSCSTSLNETVPTAELQVAYQLSETMTEVVMVASVSGSEQTQFQQHVQVPEDLNIQSLSQVVGGETTELRWSRNSPQEATVFMENDGPFQIVMVAYQTHDGLGERALPRIQLLDCVINTQELLVYRRSDVLLSPVA